MQTVAQIFLATAGAVWTLLGIYAVQNYRRNTRDQGAPMSTQEKQELLEINNSLICQLEEARAQLKGSLERRHEQDNTIKLLEIQNARLQEDLMVATSNLESARAMLQKTA